MCARPSSASRSASSNSMTNVGTSTLLNSRSVSSTSTSKKCYPCDWITVTYVIGRSERDYSAVVARCVWTSFVAMRLIHPAPDDVLHDVDRGPVVLDRDTAAFAARRDRLEHLVQQLAVRKAHDVVAARAFEAHHRIQSYIVHLSSSASVFDAPSHPDPVNCWVLQSR